MARGLLRRKEACALRKPGLIREKRIRYGDASEPSTLRGTTDIRPLRGRLKNEAESLKSGRPDAEGTTFGPHQPRAPAQGPFILREGEARRRNHRDGRRSHRTCPPISQIGIVSVNSWFLRDLRTPFGGSKQSGNGRESGGHSLEFFSELPNVCVKL